MGSTIRGLPYPLGTDRVVDGDNAIQALATAIDTRPMVVCNGSGNATTGGAVIPITAVLDPLGMVASNKITIPAGFGGMWLVSCRFGQTGVTAITGQLRKAGSTVLLQDARVGATGAAATPVLSGVISVAAGDQLELFGTAAATVAVVLGLPPLSMMFLHA